MSITDELQFKNYYLERLYITANVETGVLYNRAGRRMLALTNDFLIGLHRALEKECGSKTERVLHRCGKKWGRDFGKGLDAEWSMFYEHPAREFPIAFFQSLLIQEFGQNGWGLLDLDYQHFDKGVIQLSLEGAIMSDIYRDDITYSADALTAGILAGLFSHFLGREVECVQSQCAKQGHTSSLFLLSSPERVAMIRDQGAVGKSHAAILSALLDAESS